MRKVSEAIHKLPRPVISQNSRLPTGIRATKATSTIYLSISLSIYLYIHTYIYTYIYIHVRQSGDLRVCVCVELRLQGACWATRLQCSCWSACMRARFVSLKSLSVNLHDRAPVGRTSSDNLSESSRHAQNIFGAPRAKNGSCPKTQQR